MERKTILYVGLFGKRKTIVLKLGWGKKYTF